MSDVVVVAMVGAIPGILAVVVSVLNRNRILTVSAQLDGRLSELLELTRKAAHADGVAEGLTKTMNIETPSTPRYPFP